MSLQEEIAALKRIAAFHGSTASNLIRIWTWGDAWLNTFGSGLHGCITFNMCRNISAVVSVDSLKHKMSKRQFKTPVFTGIVSRSWIAVVLSETEILISVPPNSELVLEKLDSLL